LDPKVIVKEIIHNIILYKMDILALSNLLEQHASENEGEGGFISSQTAGPSSVVTPASFGQPKANSYCSRSDPSCNQQSIGRVSDENEIWSTDEITSCPASDPYDDREEPMYQIYFKQDIGTEDIFLGTDKSPGSFDCSHIIVKIHFPRERLEDLNLDVKSNCMVAESRNK